MNISEQWLREWANPHLDAPQLMACLTMAGLAVEACHSMQDDHVFELELTPNRGDCLSIQGVAREVAALTHTNLSPPSISLLPSLSRGEFKVSIDAMTACPFYTGVIIEGITPQANTPLLIRKRLEKSGITLIHPVVDVLNYVMLELGQPLHAFDFAKLNNTLKVRFAQPQESLILLDGRTVNLTTDTLIIADEKAPQAIAGIMGGLMSGVSEGTQTIFIESAHFSPMNIAGKARYYGLHTDASHRFERGVDPTLPPVALARAVALLKDIYPAMRLTQTFSVGQPPLSPLPILLRHSRIEKILGMQIISATIERILRALNMQIEATENLVWQVIPPTYRFDIATEIDLIEEIIRVQGYETIPASSTVAVTPSLPPPETTFSMTRLKQYLVDQGFHEIITYSFIGPEWQQWCGSETKTLSLENPLSSSLSIMRATLWPGLLATAQYNLNRQQQDFRLFEAGLCFHVTKEGALVQLPLISGIMVGNIFPEQWGQPARATDFFDAKQLLENMARMVGSINEFVWQSAMHPVLHPGKSAEIFYQQQSIGWCGALHPSLQQQWDIRVPVILFEIMIENVFTGKLPHFQEVSKFPSIRRDLALVVDRSITAATICEALMRLKNTYLTQIKVFDVYVGKNIPPDKKSLALGFLFQALDRTLVEEDIQTAMQVIMQYLTEHFQVILREA